MITIDVNTATHRGGSYDNSFKLIRSSVNKNVETGISLRRQSADVLRPDHLLLKIFELLAISHADSVDEMYYRLRDRVYAIGNALNLTSPTSYGKPHQNFILDGCNEFILIHCSEFERLGWAKLKPIEFLYHEETNINNLFGNGGSKNNVAFISINVFELAYQYRCWLRHRKATNSTESIRGFLYKYPITNAIFSYTDISLFNRILYTQQGWEFAPDKKYPLTPLMKVDEPIKKHVSYVLDAYSKQTRTIAQNLYGTELIFKLSALELIPTYRMMRSRQVGWFMDLCKLPYILYGDTFMRNTNPDYNKGWLSTIRRELTQTLDTNIWSRLQTAAPHIKERYMLFFTE